METFRTIGDMLRHNAELYAERPAFVFQGRCYSFAEVNERVNRLSHALMRLGLVKGDRVGILAYNCPQYFEVFGLAKAGLVCVPLNYRLSAEEVAYLVEDCELSALIAESELAAQVEPIRERLRCVRYFVCLDGKAAGWLDYEELLTSSTGQEPGVSVSGEDPAALFYTSGTTGQPKGALHTHQSILAESSVPHRELGPSEVALCVMPFFHVGGSTAYLFPAFYFGATTVILRKFDPALALQTIEKERVTNTCVVPIMLRRLLEHPELGRRDLSSLRTIVYTGAPMPQETIRKGLERFGPIFVQALGQTEGQLLSVLDKEGHRLGMRERPELLESAGRPYYPGEIKLVDEHDQEVPPGQVGEIVSCSGRIMREYWKQPEETARVMRGGWLHTGDLARQDQEGYIYLVDRAKDMIVSGGENIYSREVELVLESHPAVLEAAVIGVPDEEWGEAVKAIVVLREGAKATEEELIEYCKKRLASYKKPRTVEFWDSLPKNPSGKVLKREIREKYWAALERRVH